MNRARVLTALVAGITRNNVLHLFMGIYCGARMSDYEENIGSAANRDLAAMERLAQFYNPMEAVHWTYWQVLAGSGMVT